VTTQLEQAGLSPARYLDAGISFTVILHPGTWRAAPPPSLSKTELRVYDALAVGRKTVAELQAGLGLQPPNLQGPPNAAISGARAAARRPRASHLVRACSGRGETPT
jgi:ATP-dependent DNA helicase RecG